MSLRNLKKMEAREAVPGYFVKYVHTPNVTIAYWDIKAGSPLQEHEHPHEQVVNEIE
jgi:quercetin dioxygenase-like cupin family protein